MSKFIPSFFTFLMAVFLSFPLLAEPPQDEQASDLERVTFLKLNRYRTGEGLSPLIWNEPIARVARHHSLDMASGAVDFGHDGFGDRVDKLKQALVNATAFGENVFMTDAPTDQAESAVRSWLASPHHHKNIVGDYNLSAIGVWRNAQGQLYFTQIFLEQKPLDLP